MFPGYVPHHSAIIRALEYTTPQAEDTHSPPDSGPSQVGMKRRGLLAAFILGLVFGVALGPCTFIYMAPILALRAKLAPTMRVYGLLLQTAYAVGHCSAIVLAGTSTSFVQRWLNWNERSRGVVILKRVCGMLVLIVGVYLIYISR